MFDWCAISFSSFGLQHLHVHSWACSYFLLFICTMQVGFCFCIFKSKVLVFGKILSFGFCLVNFECDAYLAVDHSSVHSYPETFLLSISLISTAAWFTTIFLDSYLGFFLLLLLDIASCKTGILWSTFHSLQIFFPHFLFTMNANPYQRDNN